MDHAHDRHEGQPWWALTEVFTSGRISRRAFLARAAALGITGTALIALLALPGLVTTGLLAAIAAWNEFLLALSFTQTPDKRTVSLATSTSLASAAAASRSPGGR